MLASKLLPEQEEQQMQQLSDLGEEQDASGGTQHAGYVKVDFHLYSLRKLQSVSVLQVACVKSLCFKLPV